VPRVYRPPADYKSAIQQTENLRYRSDNAAGRWVITLQKRAVPAPIFFPAADAGTEVSMGPTTLPLASGAHSHNSVAIGST
jgi:hypothetical protein